MTENSTLKSAGESILTINGGSSSIKFARYEFTESPVRLLSGKIDRIGLDGTTLSFSGSASSQKEFQEIGSLDHLAAAEFLIDWLGKQIDVASLCGIGHRVVHGGPRYSDPQIVTPELIVELRRISPYDPDHLPSEVELIELFQNRFGAVRQVACFDTAFHFNMPRVARILPIPRRFDAKGIRRYGFHGLSYAYLMEELARIAGKDAAGGRVILAHLGNGSSLAAAKDGKSIDTSMGFTPAAGVPMSTRSGDLDPGLVSYLSRTEGINAERFHAMVNHESGLLGVSETSSDMRDLLAREKADVRAAEAVEMFCYQVKKMIGAYAAALGGLDTLVFSGGIGENSPVVRARICEGLQFLDVELDRTTNQSNDSVISAEGAAATVRVIPTNEELMIAKAVRRLVEAKK